MTYTYELYSSVIFTGEPVMIDPIWNILSIVVAIVIVCAFAVPGFLLMYMTYEINKHPQKVFDEESNTMILLNALSYDEYLDIEKDEDIIKERQKDILMLFGKFLLLALLTKQAFAVAVVVIFYALLYNVDPYVFKYFANNYLEDVPPQGS
jgi:hypothetical protein